MKLIFLLFFSFFYFSESRYYYVLDLITKKTDFETTDSSNYFCVYLDTNEFADLKEIRIFAKIYNGRFTEGEMFYGGTNDKPNQGDSVPLTLSEKCNPARYSKYQNSDYDEFTFYFNIPKPNERYLYLSFPACSLYNGHSRKIGFYQDSDLFIIIGCVIISIIVIFALIKIKK